jgi:ankyrin repeat protein
MNWLLEQGLNELEACDSLALHWAAYHERTVSMEWLIDRGVDVNVQDQNGRHTVHWAAEVGSEEVVDWLANQCANLITVDKDGVTALHVATKLNNVELMDAINSKGAIDLSVSDNNGDTPLIWASRAGRLEAIRWLIKAGATLKAKNNAGEDCLKIAVHTDQTDVIDLLTDSGCSVDLVTKYRAEDSSADRAVGRRAAEGSHNIESLIDAAMHGNVDVMEQLVEDYGIDSSGTDEYGMNALHWAAQFDQLDAVMWLVGDGVKLEEGDRYGSTALHFAALGGAIDVMGWLVARGMDTSLTLNRFGVAPLHAAAAGGSVAALDWLVHRGADLTAVHLHGGTPIHFAAAERRLHAMHWLVGQGVSIRATDKDGLTALHIDARGAERLATTIRFASTI